MAKAISGELMECCDKFVNAVEHERTIVERSQAVLLEFGKERPVAVASPVKQLTEQTQQGSADIFSDSIADFTREKQASRERAETVAALRALQAQLLEHKRAAAEETQRCYGNLVRQAQGEFKKLYGKTPASFSFWNSFSQQEYEWRSAILSYLLALVQDGKDDHIELLKIFLRGESFSVTVVRGFSVKTSEAMAVIHPTRVGSRMQVPDALPFRDAFGQIMNHRVVACLH